MSDVFIMGFRYRCWCFMGELHEASFLINESRSESGIACTLRFGSAEPTSDRFAAVPAGSRDFRSIHGDIRPVMEDSLWSKLKDETSSIRFSDRFFASSRCIPVMLFSV